MNLHDRIGRVVNTPAFERVLASKGIEKIEFQCTWNKDSNNDFEKLRPAYQDAVRAGEEELTTGGIAEIVAR